MLTDEEIEGIRKAYLAGARGDILIGLHGEERLLTQLLPAQPDRHSCEQLLARSLEQLRAIGCDGHVHIRRVLARRGKPGAVSPAIMVEEDCGGRNEKALWALD